MKSTLRSRMSNLERLTKEAEERMKKARISLASSAAPATDLAMTDGLRTYDAVDAEFEDALSELRKRLAHRKAESR